MKLLKRNADLSERGVRDFGGALSEVFSRFFSDDGFPTGLEKFSWNPRIDLIEKPGEVIVKADLPGVEEKNLSVEIRENVLVIEGKKEEEKEIKKEQARRIERFTGSFYRSIPLPEGVKSDRISAEYRQGVLTVKIPRAEESAEKKKIPVRVS